MPMNIYVGNLAKTATADDVMRLFSRHGNVQAVQIIINRVTGESRGFGFVAMPGPEEAQRAVGALNGLVHDSLPLDVHLLGSNGHSAGFGWVAGSPDGAISGAANGIAAGRPGKLPPELLDWARREFSEEEILAGIREIRETGGLELKDFIDEIEDILFSPDE